METKFNILQELREICPAVADLENTNVYSVPYFYFEALAGQILQKIKTGDIQSQAGKMDVPDGYFELLSAQIMGRIKAQQIDTNEVEQELEEVAPFLNSINRSNVYSVPEGYFENSTFSGGSLNVDELQNVAPILNSIGRSTIYTVPQGYFNLLASEILNGLKPAAKVIAIKGYKKALQYAAAAVLIGIMAISSFLFLNKETPVSGHNQLAFSEGAIKHLSDDEIMEYLNNRTNALDVTPSAFTIMAETTENGNFFEEVSDKEIHLFLNENAEPGDAALNDIL